MRIYVAGHMGMVGSAILRRLAADGRHDIITAPRSTLDLTDQRAVQEFMQAQQPDMVFLLRPKWVGSWPTPIILQALSMTTL